MNTVCPSDYSLFVTPAQAGVHHKEASLYMDSRLRRNDDVRKFWTMNLIWITIVTSVTMFLGVQVRAETKAAPAGGSLPEEVVIKGADVGQKVGATKPPLNISIDPYEEIRSSMEPNKNLFLAQSRMTVGWRHTHPELMINSRVIEPWRSIFGGHSSIVFNVRQQLLSVVPNGMTDREMKKYQWSLTIADDAGRVFQQFHGSKNPPDELFWNGQNNFDQWIQCGRTYSAVYQFTDPGGQRYTRIGKPMRMPGVAHPETIGMVISLDSAVLFGGEKDASSLDRAGGSLIRDAADYIKRNYADVSLMIRAFAASKELAEAQGQAVQARISQELVLAPQTLSVQTDVVPFTDQRVEVIVLNR